MSATPFIGKLFFFHPNIEDIAITIPAIHPIFADILSARDLYDRTKLKSGRAGDDTGSSSITRSGDEWISPSLVRR